MTDKKDAAYWLKKEIAECARDGAVPVKNSGRGLKKGDAILDNDFVVDYKMTDKSFTLSTKVWAKVQTDAWSNGNRIPAIKTVFFADGEVPAVRLWIIDDETFRDYRRLKAQEVKEHGAFD